ncbi:hypothetical protein EOE65_08555 [Neptunomonas marina]|uniref:Uncharacterized protein n=1 Tax=Neptunomonas marina TaxID=1815562 RepID=A0A437Q9D6_9GAMM|nr:hypothetical protein EOE65_08555 [Neptunomonas marina]
MKIAAKKRALLKKRKAEQLAKLRAEKAHNRRSSDKPNGRVPSSSGAGASGAGSSGVNTHAVAAVATSPNKSVETNAAALLPIIEKKKALEDQLTAPSIDKKHVSDMATVFGHLPDLDWSQEADRRRLQISLDGMLLPWIEKAVADGREKSSSVAIDGLHLRLEYLPWTDCFVTNLTEEVLYTVMTSRFGMGELSIKFGDVIEEDLQDGLGFSERVMTAQDLLWLSGLWTVQGRILPNDDPTRTRRLKYAPECVRNIAVPEVHAVINLWQTRPMSAFQVISELQIPQRYVFGVMAAATTAQLFEY